MALKQTFFSKALGRFLRRKLSMVLTAFMLGMSNIILQEERTIHDTRAKIEHQEIQSEDDQIG
jgi:hypothetical protein